MRAYKALFVLIRANPKGFYYIDLLRAFEKYMDLDLNSKKIAMLKSDINHIKNVDAIEKDYLINELNVYNQNRIFYDINKLNKYAYVLPIVANEMIKLLERKEYERVYDFTDAVHNLPEFLVTDSWTADNYYKVYIKPYNKKWKATFLCELKGR